MPGPISHAVVVSPHLDDGVFSCGAFLAAHPASVVVTVFAGRPGPGPLTEWDRSSGFDDGDDVVGRRREEDAAALARLGARPRWLDFLDAQYGAAPPVEAVADGLEKALVDEQPDAVLVPLGLFHDDHRTTHAAALAVARRRPEWRWFAYEDALYRRVDDQLAARRSALAAEGLRLATAGAVDPRPAGHRRPRRPGTVLAAAVVSGDGAGVSVVVLTRNRADEVSATVGRLLALPARPAVIVVDNGSSDGTAARLTAEYPEVDVIEAGANLGAAGRNVGVRRATTPFVALSDDDTWWLPGSLDRARAALEADPRIAVVSGRVVVGPDGEDDATCALMAASPLPARPGLPGPAILGFLAGASMVRRDAFLAAGGFEPRLLIGAEEELLALDLARLGWDVVYVDDVVVRHRPSPRRDGDGRRVLHVRNRLWVSWLRHPPDLVARRTASVLRRAARDAVAARGLARAAAGLPWVVRHRRALPPRVAAAARLVEAADTGPGGAPAYAGSTNR